MNFEKTTKKTNNKIKTPNIESHKSMWENVLKCVMSDGRLNFLAIVPKRTVCLAQTSNLAPHQKNTIAMVKHGGGIIMCCSVLFQLELEFQSRWTELGTFPYISPFWHKIFRHMLKTEDEEKFHLCHLLNNLKHKRMASPEENQTFGMAQP